MYLKLIMNKKTILFRTQFHRLYINNLEYITLIFSISKTYPLFYYKFIVLFYIKGCLIINYMVSDIFQLTCVIIIK